MWIVFWQKVGLVNQHKYIIPKAVNSLKINHLIACTKIFYIISANSRPKNTVSPALVNLKIRSHALFLTIWPPISYFHQQITKPRYKTVICITCNCFKLVALLIT
ncbi:hypothetical protein Hanom_Chr14g01317881 [Helianthus anomalus]